jgi:hypothetical protein
VYKIFRDTPVQLCVWFCYSFFHNRNESQNTHHTTISWSITADRYSSSHDELERNLGSQLNEEEPFPGHRGHVGGWVGGGTRERLQCSQQSTAAAIPLPSSLGVKDSQTGADGTAMGLHQPLFWGEHRTRKGGREGLEKTWYSMVMIAPSRPRRQQMTNPVVTNSRMDVAPPHIPPPHHHHPSNVSTRVVVLKVTSARWKCFGWCGVSVLGKERTHWNARL